MKTIEHNAQVSNIPDSYQSQGFCAAMKMEPRTERGNNRCHKEQKLAT